MFDKATFDASVCELRGLDSVVPGGFVTTVYFDPEDSKLVASTESRNTQLAAAFHKRIFFLFQVPNEALLDSVANVVMALEPFIIAVGAAWHGSEWDGRNHVGRWDEEALADIPQAIEDTVRATGFSVPWDAEDWLAEDAEHIYDLHVSGNSTEEIVGKLHLGTEGDDEGFVSKAAAIAFVEKVIESPEDWGVEIDAKE